MSRLTLTLFMFMVALFGFYLGWFGVSTSTSGSRSDFQFSVDREKIRADLERKKSELKETGHELELKAEEIKNVIREKAHSPEEKISLSKTFVIMMPDSKTQIKVIRSTGQPTSLSMAVSPKSYLRVSGGEFKEGEKETTITIEALPEARDGEVIIESGGASETLKVRVSANNRTYLF